MKPIAKWMLFVALLVIFGCGKKDLNKDLKPVESGGGKPQLIKDGAKDDSAKALK